MGRNWDENTATVSYDEPDSDIDDNLPSSESSSGKSVTKVKITISNS